MKRIPLIAALALLFVSCFAYVLTREVRASNDPCFHDCSGANNYIDQQLSGCSGPTTRYCSMDSGGTPNGGYGYSCMPNCHWTGSGYSCTGSGFGGGGVIHDYCTN
jgi:hypothetical protein